MLAPLIVFVSFGIATGIIGRAKGGSFFIWFLVGDVLPGIGLIAVILHRSEVDEPERQCPRCGRVQKLYVQVCRGCGEDLYLPDPPRSGTRAPFAKAASGWSRTRYVLPPPTSPPRRPARVDLGASGDADALPDLVAAGDRGRRAGVRGGRRVRSGHPGPDREDQLELPDRAPRRDAGDPDELPADRARSRTGHSPPRRTGPSSISRWAWSRGGFATA